MNTRPLRVCMVTTFYPPYNFGGDGIAELAVGALELATRAGFLRQLAIRPPAVDQNAHAGSLLGKSVAASSGTSS